MHFPCWFGAYCNTESQSEEMDLEHQLLTLYRRKSELESELAAVKRKMKTLSAENEVGVLWP